VYFAFALFTIAAAASLICTRTLLGYNHVEMIWKILLCVLLFTAWMSPPILWLVRDKSWLQQTGYAVFSQVCYFMFGVAFLLFAFLLIRDFLWLCGYGIAKLFHWEAQRFSPFNVALLTKVNIITVLMVLAVSFYALYQGIKLPSVKEVVIKTPKVDREVSILQVNDLHIDRTKSLLWLQQVVTEINRQNADIVVMPGDIIDDNVAVLAKALEVLKGVQAKYGVWFVAGNHELYNGLPSIIREIKNIGFQYLSGEGKKVDGLPLYIAGIPDIPSYYGKKANYPGLEGQKDGSYRILLAHSPVAAKEYIERGFDLQLSGHTHGGQIFPFQIPVKYANHYLAGNYDFGNGKLYISRGAGYWGPPMRLLAPSDITLIRLIPQ